MKEFFINMPIFFKIFSGFWFIFFASLLPLFFIYRFWFFFRNPRRRVPEGNNITSPADGMILYIKKIKNDGEVPISVKKGKKIYLGELIGENKINYNLVIGIFMTPFSVHHNRIPFSGKITSNYYKTSHNNKSMLIGFLNLLLNLRPFTENASFILENERNTITLENDIIKGAVVQIADNWVNNIQNISLKPGKTVIKGERFGMIRMGSQCDLYLKIDENYKILVKERQYVKAGKNILIEIE